MSTGNSYNKILIVGLGNPDEKYRHTRHNVGHMLIEYMAEYYKIKMSPGKGRFYFGKKRICGCSLHLIRTTTYMNNSGIAVRAVKNQFDAVDSEILVVCDDFNLPLGTIRLRLNGSDGGQKGLRSIVEVLGSQNFPRLRIGIKEKDRFDAVDFVLSEFSSGEKKILSDVLEDSRKCIEMLVCRGPQKAMGEFNKRIRE